MKPFWLRILPYIAAIALVAAALLGAYHHGLSVKDAEWQAQWSGRDTRDAAAKVINEAAERDKEQARQLSINKAIQDGQQIIDQVAADAAAARASDDSLRRAADNLAARLTASEASGNSCTAAASKAAAHAAAVLADVFKRADERAGNLAAYADQSHVRGLTCEQAYISLGKN